MSSPFHFPSLVWGESIAIYLFLLGISAGGTMISILLKRRGLLGENLAESNILRCNAILAPVTIMIGLILLIFHLVRPWTFWYLMFNYQPHSIMSIGVMLFQVYMAMLCLWIAIIFKDLILSIVRKIVPKLENFVAKAIDFFARFNSVIETILLLVSIALGAYTGFLLSALVSYPMLNNPVLPILFLISGTSSGIAAIMLFTLLFTKEKTTSKAMSYLHSLEFPVVCSELFLLFAFFFGLYLGGGQKTVSMYTAIGGGFWSYVFWSGVVGIGLILPLSLTLIANEKLKHQRKFIYLTTGLTLLGVLCLRFFILYAGQMTLA